MAYTVPEVAHSLGLSRSTAYQLCAAGELPTRHVGSRVLVPAKALDEYLARVEVR